MGDAAAGLILTKPKSAWLKPWPKPSMKILGSFALTQASMVLVPSMVEVWTQLIGLPLSSNCGGTTVMPYLPGARFLIIASPTLRLYGFLQIVTSVRQVSMTSATVIVVMTPVPIWTKLPTGPGVVARPQRIAEDIGQQLAGRRRRS